MDNASLNIAAKQLEQLVTSSGFMPQAVLSIERGGAYVGNLMFGNAVHLSTLLQRPGTRKKNSFITSLLPLMPIKVCDFLRILESWWLARRKQKHVDPDSVTLPDVSKYQRILIVDDAVDSGSTLEAVIRAVKQKSPHAAIKSAVITVTSHGAMYRPDYSIYNNLTLIRFPWSKDNRKTGV